MPLKTIYSCIFSLSYNKGFTILFTESINSTCTIIEEYLNRIIEKIVSKLSEEELSPRMWG